MNEEVHCMRPQALAEYLIQRYRVQPGQGLCLVLGQRDAGDNFQALNAWVHEAVRRHHELCLFEQVQAIEQELCRLMVDSGVVDEAAIADATPAGWVAEIFGHKPVSTNVHAPGRTSRPRTGPYPENIIPFPTGPHRA